MKKLDILAFAAHPDDVELSCAGTLMKHIDQGLQVGVVDLTVGQLGSRGTPELRLEEAKKASEIMGLHVRENLGMEDGYFENNWTEKIKIIEMLRKYRPEIVLCNAIRDRHPDHGKGAKLVSEACFYSGLAKVETSLDGESQEHWRPKVIYHYIQDRWIQPDFVVDVSAYYERKIEAIQAFSSQFFQPGSTGPQTPISGEDFMEAVKGRLAQHGRQIMVRYGEGFTVERPVGVNDLRDLI